MVNHQELLMFNGLYDIIKVMKIQRVRESQIGVYVWELPNGNYLANTDGEILNVPSEFGDLAKMAELQRAASHYGYPDGKAVFEEVHRCTEQEYQDQLQQLIETGETPYLGIRK